MGILKWAGAPWHTAADHKQARLSKRWLITYAQEHVFDLHTQTCTPSFLQHTIHPQVNKPIRAQAQAQPRIHARAAADTRISVQANTSVHTHTYATHATCTHTPTHATHATCTHTPTHLLIQWRLLVQPAWGSPQEQAAQRAAHSLVLEGPQAVVFACGHRIRRHGCRA